MSELGAALLDLLYPPRCAACREGLGSSAEEPFCQTCRDAVDPVPPGCARCGLPGPDPGLRRVPRRPAAVRRLPGRRALRRPARRRRPRLQVWGPPRPGASARRLDVGGRPLAGRSRGGGGAARPAPPLARGYDQAALLARAAARARGPPFLAGAVRRVRETPPQVGRSRAERRANVRGAFAAGPAVRGLRPRPRRRRRHDRRHRRGLRGGAPRGGRPLGRGGGAGARRLNRWSFPARRRNRTGGPGVRLSRWCPPSSSPPPSPAPPLLPRAPPPIRSRSGSRAARRAGARPRRAARARAAHRAGAARGRAARSSGRASPTRAWPRTRRRTPRCGPTPASGSPTWSARAGTCAAARRSSRAWPSSPAGSWRGRSTTRASAASTRSSRPRSGAGPRRALPGQGRARWAGARSRPRPWGGFAHLGAAVRPARQVVVYALTGRRGSARAARGLGWHLGAERRWVKVFVDGALVHADPATTAPASTPPPSTDAPPGPRTASS